MPKHPSSQPVEPEEPILTYDSDELDTVPEDESVEPMEPTRPLKPKRHMSAKQLDNLSKAREKARCKLAEKRQRTTALKQQEKRLRELKMKRREEDVEKELLSFKSVSVAGDEEVEPVRYVRKGKKKKKPPKVVYYSSSDEDSDEPEIVYKRRPRRPSAPPAPRHAQENEENEADAYQQHLMNQLFPS